MNCKQNQTRWEIKKTKKCHSKILNHPTPGPTSRALSVALRHDTSAGNNCFHKAGGLIAVFVLVPAAVHGAGTGTAGTSSK